MILLLFVHQTVSILLLLMDRQSLVGLFNKICNNISFVFLKCVMDILDSTEDAKLELDGKPIVVPQGKPKARGIQSSFSQSEYLIYKENQNRIRYLLKMKF